MSPAFTKPLFSFSFSHGPASGSSVEPHKSNQHLPFLFFNVHPNITHTFASGCYKWAFSLTFLSKTFQYILSSLSVSYCTCPAHLFLVDLITLIISGETPPIEYLHYLLFSILPLLLPSYTQVY